MKKILYVFFVISSLFLISCQALLDSGVFSGAAKDAVGVPYEKVNFFEGAVRKVFGVSTSTVPSNEISPRKNFGAIDIKSVDGKGKIDLSGQSGIAFYYRKVDASKNFILQATFEVKQFGDIATNPGITASNGQEAFGIMARDSVPEGRLADTNSNWEDVSLTNNNNTNYWVGANRGTANMVMLGGVKRGVRLAWQQGIVPTGAEDGRVGTEEFPNVKDLKSGSRPAEFSDYSMYSTLEARPDFPAKGEIYTLTLQKNNSGFLAKIVRPAQKKDALVSLGEYAEELMYYAPQDLLIQQEKDAYYVGFFCARNAIVYIKNISYHEVNSASDIPRREEVIVPVTPQLTIVSPLDTADETYAVHLKTNASGYIRVKQDGNEIAYEQVAWSFLNKNNPESGSGSLKIDANKLKLGDNNFIVSFYPDASEKQLALDKNGSPISLTSTSVVAQTFTVVRKEFSGVSVDGANAIYVSPSGRANATGQKSSPLDLNSALKYIKPGQEIIMLDGIYPVMDVYIDRYNSGTSTAYKILRAENTDKAIIDFSKVVGAKGFELWGSYWKIQGIHVRNTPDKVKGFVVSGNNNIISYVKVYNNGDTGLQISGRSTESFNMWPQNNIVEYCESYNNADRAMIDADGFAAKLTVGNGNRFSWCVSHHNADDGWDLFAKKDTGPIGVVVLENCISYYNGMTLQFEGETHKVGATSGRNGFKLGGSGIPVPHVIKNSIAFRNGAHGFDSNSNPALQIYNCTALDNGHSLNGKTPKSGKNFNIYDESARNTGIPGKGVNVLSVFKEMSVTADGLDSATATGFFAWKKDTATDIKVQNNKATAELLSNDIQNYTIPFVEGEFNGKVYNEFIERNTDGTFNLGNFLTVADAAATEKKQSGVFSLIRKPDQINQITMPASITIFKNDSKQITVKEMYEFYSGTLSWQVSPPVSGIEVVNGLVSVAKSVPSGTTVYVSATANETGASGTTQITIPASINTTVAWKFNELKDPNTSALLNAAYTGTWTGTTAVNSVNYGYLDWQVSKSTRIFYKEGSNPIILLGGSIEDESYKKIRFAQNDFGIPSSPANNGFSAGQLACNSSEMVIADFGYVKGPFTLTMNYAAGTAGNFPSVSVNDVVYDTKVTVSNTGSIWTHSYEGTDEVPVKILAGAVGNSSRIFDFKITK